MNIAIMIQSLVGGGAERVAQVLGDYLVDRGYNVFYFLGNSAVKQDYEVKGKLIYTNINGYCLRKDRKSFMRDIAADSWKIRKLKKEYQIDAAISFMEDSNYINILSKGREKIFTRICTIISKAKSDSLYNDKEIIQYFYRKSNKIIIMSKYAWKEMHEYYGIPEKNLVKLENPVKKPEGENTAEEWNYGKKAIVCAGRLVTEKQQERLLRAFSYTLKREPEATLIIIGKGVNRQLLKDISIELGIEGNVVFVGFTSQLGYYFANARAFVMASRIEGFPNAMIEAMSCGVPVITTDSPGGCVDIVGRENTEDKVTNIEYCPYGIVTPYIESVNGLKKVPLTAEEELLGEAMAQMTANDKLYKHYKSKSLERVKLYDRDKIGRQWEELIRESQSRNLLQEVSNSIRGYYASVLQARGKVKVKDNSGKGRFEAYFYLLEQWLTLKEEGKSIIPFLEERNYHKIAIYGMSKIGNHLYEELKKSEIEISYFIDRNPKAVLSWLPVYQPSDDLPETDAIIVTPVSDYENIRQTLFLKTNAEIISLKDVIEGADR